MKVIINVILAVLAFTWISGVSAGNGSNNQSPESMMTCGGGVGGSISVVSVPDFINKEGCPAYQEGACASCIISLENQGCKVIDVVVTHFRFPESVASTGTTYLLSCAKP